jgi:ketosteroid isomerase-like protein
LSEFHFSNPGGNAMRIRIILILMTILLIPIALPQPSPAQSSSDSPTARQLTAMLNQFLNDAARNNAAGFDTFFADDVIYTRSAGAVTTKAEIMKSVSASAARGPALESTTTYSAEDVTIHEYGDTAVVAFRLVSRQDHSAGKPPSISNYRNTGTFLKRNGRWQVIAWQSTKIPDAPAAN